MVIYKSYRKCCRCKSNCHCDQRHRCEDRHEYKEVPRRKLCHDSLSEFIESAAEIENSLANAINAETHLMKTLDFTPKEAIQFSKKLEDLIKLAIKKEIILGFLLEETMKACKDQPKCKKCESHHCKCHH
ncbi:hypothetical protein [Oceanobacillus sp. CF4.6]|uniref:hypothetical protein n=1 Tax=Oceanobacillus sp. CF4.6 TaxID=3373080 RepID=UPI003EE71ED5